MIELLKIIAGVFGYITIGYIINKINIFPKKLTEYFDLLCFNILLPLALICYFWQVTFPSINSFGLMLSFFGSGIIIFFTGFFTSRFLFNYKPDDSSLFGLASCFGNSVAMGIPLMYSILGPINTIPYMILVFFHGFIHFTYTTVIIEIYRNRKSNIIQIIGQTILGLLKNIVLFGMIIGITLNYSKIDIPIFLEGKIQIFVTLALPLILISLGIALGNFKIKDNIKLAFILTFLKNFLHPSIAFIISYFLLNLDDLLVIIVTIAAALPSGSQSYYFAYRYNSLKGIISSNVVLSTATSFFTISALLLFFNIT